MKEEIFGPVLPIITYLRPLDVIKHIQSGPSPLTIYYFGKKDSVICRRLSEFTRSGHFIVNEMGSNFL